MLIDGGAFRSDELSLLGGSGGVFSEFSVVPFGGSGGVFSELPELLESSSGLLGGVLPSSLGATDGALLLSGAKLPCVCCVALDSCVAVATLAIVKPAATPRATTESVMMMFFAKRMWF